MTTWLQLPISVVHATDVSECLRAAQRRSGDVAVEHPLQPDHRPLSDIYVVWNETRLPGDTRRALMLKYTHLIAFWGLRRLLWSNCELGYTWRLLGLDDLR
jgi:hypothetical protein